MTGSRTKAAIALWLLAVPLTAQTLYNGITLAAPWPPLRGATQAYQVPSYITNPPAVIPIDVGRQLFVDDFLIEQTNLTRTPHQPVPYGGNPVLRPGAWDTNNNSFPYSDGVWFDPKDNLYKMFYYGDNGAYISYAYSTDGMNWVKPSIPDAAAPNSNRVLQIGGGRDSVTVWLDYEETNPARRFKAFAYYPPNFIWVYFSPDGIHWSGVQPISITSVSDRTTMFWNPFRKVWVESERRRIFLPDTPSRPGYTARARLYVESPNLLAWTPSDFISSFWTGPDDHDPQYVAGGAYPELYNLDAVAYESLMVGLFSFWYPGPSYSSTYAAGPNLVEINVGFSRDGYQWVRPTRGNGANAFLPAHPGSWDGYDTQSAGGCFLVVGDELWFYFSGRSQQKPDTGIGQTGLAKLRRDGFYSMDAGGSTGTLTTRPVRFSGSHLFVNLDAPGGQLQAEVLDTAGNPIAPFTRANSVAAGVNSTRRELTWSGASDLSSLAGRAVKFRFYLTNGKLYSFWVTPHPGGASYGYVAAGGPGFSGPVDNGGGVAPVSMPVISPAGGSYTTPVTVTLSSPTAGAVIRYTLDGSTPTASSNLYSGPLTISSTTTLSAVAFGGTGQSAVSTATFVIQTNIPPPPGTGTAGFLKADFSTAGNWKSSYGADGYNVINNAVQYPSNVVVSVGGASSYTWSTTTQDVRALNTATGSDHIAACWFSSGVFTVDFSFSDSAAHTLAAYFLDWDYRARNQTVEMLDSNNNLLDSRPLSNFTGGVYLVWNVTGRVRLRVTNNGGVNAVLSGLFLGGPRGGGPTPVPNAASFLRVDSSTLGNWVGVYGADGYNLINAAAAYPAYAAVNPAGASSYVWVAATGDSRALQRPVGNDHVAACWFGQLFTIDLNFNDSNTHQVAMYMLDWDSTARAQQVDVLDPSGQVLDTRSVSAFNSGKYLVWNMSGHVIVRITRLAGVNAVLSGIFFR